jgi:Zn-finger nucleic acid-binding protein
MDSDTDPRAKLIDCPKCGTHMARHTSGDLHVDRCSTCSGLWLDAMELPRVLANPAEVARLDKGRHAASTLRNTVRKINCPRDHSPLIAVSDPAQPHVHYEQCSVCGGVFLDSGELKDLSEFTLKERLRALLG